MLYEQGFLIPCFPAQNRIMNMFPVEELLMQEEFLVWMTEKTPLVCLGSHSSAWSRRTGLVTLASPRAPSRKVPEISFSTQSSVVDSECMKHIWKINYLLINPSPFLPYLMALPYPWNAIFVVYDWLDEARKENKLGWLQNGKKIQQNPPKPAKLVDL